PFCIPRSRVRTLRLRRERVVVCRARLEADRVLAMVGKFVSGRVAEAAHPVNRMRNYALRPKCGCSFNAFFTGRAGFSVRFSGAGFSGGASDAIAATVVDSTLGSGAGSALGSGFGCSSAKTAPLGAFGIFGNFSL